MTSVHIERLKSWENTGVIRLAPFTGFFGPNSSGKTTLLQLFLLMKQTVESSDRRQILHTGDHPVQAGLADVFIDAIKTRKIQIIVESHSEHLLRRIQRRIAEDGFTKEQTALYFCESDSNGISRITELALDLFGNITNWPADFFGDELGESIAMVEAEMRRRQVRGNL